MRPASCDPFIDRLGRVVFDGFAASARAFLDGPFQERAVLDEIDRCERQIEEIVAEDEHGPGFWGFRAAVDGLRTAIPRLRRNLEAEIGR